MALLYMKRTQSNLFTDIKYPKTSFCTSGEKKKNRKKSFEEKLNINRTYSSLIAAPDPILAFEAVIVDIIISKES